MSEHFELLETLAEREDVSPLLVLAVAALLLLHAAATVLALASSALLTHVERREARQRG